MARIFPAAGIFADQIAGAVEEAFKFLFAVELRDQRLSYDFGLGAVEVARPAVQPFSQIVRNFQGQRLHEKQVTPVCRIDNTNFHLRPPAPLVLIFDL